MRYHDPVIDELRKVRDTLAKECDYDIEKMVEAAKERQEASGRKVVTLPPRMPIQIPEGPARQRARRAS
jgi:hypothetical protein